jgi:ankyrin repeat protein
MMNKIESCIKSNNLDELKSIYPENSDVNKRHDEGKTPLMYACEFQKLDVVKYLLSIGADPTIKDDKNFDSEGIAFWYGEASMGYYTRNCKLIVKELRASINNT